MPVSRLLRLCIWPSRSCWCDAASPCCSCSPSWPLPSTSPRCSPPREVATIASSIHDDLTGGRWHWCCFHSVSGGVWNTMEVAFQRDRSRLVSAGSGNFVKSKEAMEAQPLLFTAPCHQEAEENSQAFHHFYFKSMFSLLVQGKNALMGFYLSSIPVFCVILLSFIWFIHCITLATIKTLTLGILAAVWILRKLETGWLNVCLGDNASVDVLVLHQRWRRCFFSCPLICVAKFDSNEGSVRSFCSNNRLHSQSAP